MVYGRKTYNQRAIQSIKEMMRVLKPKGRLYLTTDFYLPEQKSDNWPYSKKNINGAFEWTILKNFGKLLDVKTESWKEKLVKGNCHTYRGRFFATAAFWWKK